MIDTEDTRAVVILSEDDEVRERIARALSAALVPTTYAMPEAGCTLLIADAPDLSEDDAPRFVASLVDRWQMTGGGHSEHATPLILLNNNATAATREAAYLAGAADILARNVASELLVARVTRLMAMSAMLAEARNLGERALLDTTSAGRKTKGRVFQLRPSGAAPAPQSDKWDLTTFGTPEALLSATMQDWPDVIALPGATAARLLPGLISRRGALNTHFLTLDTPDDARGLCLSLGAADAIPSGVSTREVITRISTLTAAAQDIHRAHDDLRAGLEMSHSDALTGLRNRRFFDQRFRGLFERARLLAQPLSVLAFDIDDFKHINDLYGHPTGDEILKHFASRLLGNVREQDLVTRYGGEEFLIAMPQAGIEVAMGAAERVRAAIAAPGFPIGKDLVAQMTVSVGVATIGCADGRAEDLLARADAALYQAKGLGRNRVARAA